jgi:hypothetical protein
MTAGHIGNGHARLIRVGQNDHLLIERKSAPALPAGEDFDSIRIVGHRHMARRKRIGRADHSITFAADVIQLRLPLNSRHAPRCPPEMTTHGICHVSLITEAGRQGGISQAKALLRYQLRRALEPPP